MEEMKTKFNLKPMAKLNDSMDNLPREQAEAVRMAVIRTAQETSGKANFRRRVLELLKKYGIVWTKADMDRLMHNVGYGMPNEKTA